jgi:hypothetical protein
MDLGVCVRRDSHVSHALDLLYMPAGSRWLSAGTHALGIFVPAARRDLGGGCGGAAALLSVSDDTYIADCYEECAECP